MHENPKLELSFLATLCKDPSSYWTIRDIIDDCAFTEHRKLWYEVRDAIEERMPLPDVDAEIVPDSDVKGAAKLLMILYRKRQFAKFMDQLRTELWAAIEGKSVDLARVNLTRAVQYIMKKRKVRINEDLMLRALSRIGCETDTNPELELQLLATLSRFPDLYWSIKNMVHARIFTVHRMLWYQIRDAIEEGSTLPSVDADWSVSDFKKTAEELVKLYDKRQFEEFITRLRAVLEDNSIDPPQMDTKEIVWYICLNTQKR